MGPGTLRESEPLPDLLLWGESANPCLLGEERQQVGGQGARENTPRLAKPAIPLSQDGLQKFLALGEGHWHLRLLRSHVRGEWDGGGNIIWRKKGGGYINTNGLYCVHFFTDVTASRAPLGFYIGLTVCNGMWS